MSEVEQSAESTEKSTRGKTRQEIGEILNSPARRRAINKLVDQALELNGLEWGYCPQCSKKVRVEVADVKGRVDALIKLLEQAEGKPRDEDTAGLTLVVERIWPE